MHMQRSPKTTPHKKKPLFKHLVGHVGCDTEKFNSSTEDGFNHLRIVRNSFDNRSRRRCHLDATGRNRCPGPSWADSGTVLYGTESTWRRLTNHDSWDSAGDWTPIVLGTMPERANFEMFRTRTNDLSTCLECSRMLRKFLYHNKISCELILVVKWPQLAHPLK